MTELTKEQIKAGWTPEKMKAHLAEVERRTAERVFAVFDRRPPLRIERTRSAFDWTRKSSAHDWWRNNK